MQEYANPNGVPPSEAGQSGNVSREQIMALLRGAERDQVQGNLMLQNSYSEIQALIGQQQQQQQQQPQDQRMIPGVPSVVSRNATPVVHPQQAMRSVPTMTPVDMPAAPPTLTPQPYQLPAKDRQAPPRTQQQQKDAMLKQLRALCPPGVSYEALLAQATTLAAEAMQAQGVHATPSTIPSADTSIPTPFTIRAGEHEEEDDLPTQFSANMVDTDTSKNYLMQNLQTHSPAMGPPSTTYAPQQPQQQQQIAPMNALPQYAPLPLPQPLPLPHSARRAPLLTPTETMCAGEPFTGDIVDLARRLAYDLRARPPTPPPLPVGASVDPLISHVSHTGSGFGPTLDEYTRAAAALTTDLPQGGRPDVWSEIQLGLQ